MRMCSLVVCLLLSSSTALARDIYVDNVLGDDRRQGTSAPPTGERPRLEPREWCVQEGWIYFRVDAGLLPAAYKLSWCREQVGITLYNVHDVIIEDLHVRGFWLDGVNCHDNVRRADLVRITA